MHEKEIAKSCMDRTGALDFFNRDFNTLSDGEKQKVMLARCLAQNCPVLLLDEPLAFLDYPGRRQMLAMLQKICHEENKIIIYSSHDLDISLQYCDKLLLIREDHSWHFIGEKEIIQNLDPAVLFIPQ